MIAAEWILTVCIASPINPCALMEQDTYIDKNECLTMEAEIEFKIPSIDAQCAAIITEEV